MNLSSSLEQNNFNNRDSLQSGEQYSNNNKEELSNKNEGDMPFELNISETSQEIRNKYHENSEIKNKKIDNDNNNQSESNIDNDKLNNKKYTFSSQKSNKEIISKNNSSYKEIQSLNSINNNNYIKTNFKKKNDYPTELITNYKLWTGNNYFPLKAKMIEGPSGFKPTLMTGTAITAPIILFFIFDVDYLSDELTPFIPILIMILYIIIIVNLILATFCDPGIIRKFHIKNINNINGNKNKNNKRIISKIFHLGKIISYKYCYTCGIMRPNKSTHCHVCNNCVERLDHHCPWIGNCTGKRNYIYFFIFLALLNLLQILIIIFCIVHVIKVKNDFNNSNNKLSEEERIPNINSFSLCEVIVSLYLIIYSILSMFFTTRLIIYHVYIILNDITTKEKENNVYYNGIPYTRKKLQNVKNILFPIIKKYSILDILRGDFKEICDKKDQNDSKNETKILNDDYINNETVANLKINKLMISLNEYKPEKNDETNFGLNEIKENSQNKLIPEEIINPNIQNKSVNNFINSTNVDETNDNITENNFNKEKDIIKDYPEDTIP